MNTPEHRHQPSAAPAPERVGGAHPERHEDDETDPPAIYVASLADYNAGRLHGIWIDATQDLATINGQIAEMLNRSPEPGAEEIAIHDYTNFGGWQLSEYESVHSVKAVADAITEHGEAVTHWIDYLGAPADEAIESFTDAYVGNWETMREYAEELADAIGVEVSVDPPSWETYVKIDYDAVARDLDFEMHIGQAKDGSIYVFDPSMA